MSKLKIVFIIILVYWSLATLLLLDIMYSSGNLFSFGLDMIFFPGCIIGFSLGYSGGVGLGIFGQLIELIAIVGLYLLLSKLTNKQET